MGPLRSSLKSETNTNGPELSAAVASSSGGDGGEAGGSTPVIKSTPKWHRGGSRGMVHPAYAPLERVELPNVEEDESLEGIKLQVQVRTRESGRWSPLVATPTQNMWHSPANARNPYGSETESPTSATPAVAKQEVTPPFSPLTVPLEPLPPNVVHRALLGKCRFIPFPTLPPYDPPPTPQMRTYPLFIGQVRFEASLAELMWLFHRTSGACALTIEGRGSGCFILHLRSESERMLVRQLHKRILFDIGGVWFARTSQEVDSLCEHVALDGPYLSKQAKLPRDSMVVEDIKVDANDSHISNPFYYAQRVPTPPYGGSMGGWGRTSSTRSTPTRVSYNSVTSSPIEAPLPPATWYPPMSLYEAPAAESPHMICGEEWKRNCVYSGGAKR
ncbi:hypothetical protein DQ04_04801040 [Trypanosoma grayi]|uniref:hypothetical protein n=1 Tax=Trypanosoma grayi TaxID=71804 RepID=UPI0004F47DB2|nr:hypothetical protein DQ04_04801040 [Trypanosoma grayi]KEG09692.1 hypothetical protein DQ04_04801040 [Trypanosoma grayi]